MWKGKYSEKLLHKKMLQLPDEYTIFNDSLLDTIQKFHTLCQETNLHR